MNSRAVISTLCFIAVMNCVNLSYVQAQRAKDTIQVAVNELIELPRGRPSVRNDAIAPKFEVTITDAKGSSRSGKYKQLMGPKNQTTGSVTVLNFIRETLTDTGLFTLRMNLSGRDEFGRRFSDDSVWTIRAVYPTLTNSLSVPPTYYYGESPEITFATLEYSDARSYRYVIEGGGGTKAGVGSTIRLDSIVNNVKNAGSNAQFVVRGFYDNRTFRFRNPLTNKIDSTVWRFTVVAPILEVLSAWDSVGGFATGAKTFDMRRPYDFGPTQFRFVFTARRGNAWLQIPLDPQNFQVSAKVLNAPRTDQFVGGLLDQNQPYTTTPHRFFHIVNLQPDTLFLQSIPEGRYVDVELTITGSDQFGRALSLVRRASVY